MSIIYCEKHDRRWDSDFLMECPACENEPAEEEPRLFDILLQRDRELTAKTVSFQDLARAECVYVSVHGMNLNLSGAWNLAQATAREHGFRLQA